MPGTRSINRRSRHAGESSGRGLQVLSARLHLPGLLVVVAALWPYGMARRDRVAGVRGPADPAGRRAGRTDRPSDAGGRPGLAGTVAEIQASGIDSDDALRQQMASEAVHRGPGGEAAEPAAARCRSRCRMRPAMRSTPRASGRPPAPTCRPAMSSGTSATQDDDGPYLSKPEDGRLPANGPSCSGRRIRGRDGQFAGVVGRHGVAEAISPTSLPRSIRTSSALISLLRRDGTILVRHPPLPAFIGHVLAPTIALVQRAGSRRRRLRRTGFPSADWRGRPRSGRCATTRW